MSDEELPSNPSSDPDDSLPSRLLQRWSAHLDNRQHSSVLAWGSFAVTFAGVRALTHWIRDGHGPAGGAMSVGGHHFHHYNLGIALMTVVGAIALRGEDRHRHHPLTAVSYGVANALIANEAALLIDLEDVYWAKEGRTSVDLAIGIIAVGGVAVAGWSLWPALAQELRPRNRRTLSKR